MTDHASEPRVLVRWQLGTTLAKLRRDAGLIQDEVSAHLDWNGAKISRIENGDLGVQTSDLRALLDLYRYTDADESQRLEELARASRSRQKRTGNEHLIRGKYLTYEDAATSVTCWEPYIVPGLLQTEAYLRARLAACHPEADEDEIDRRAQLRLTRQQRLTVDDPLRLTAVFDESVLQRAYGGPDILRDQLDHLLARGKRRNITIQVLPSARGDHPLVSGPATHLGYEGKSFELVYFEGIPNDYYEVDAEAVGRYREALTTIRALALDPNSSARRIQQAMADLR